MLLTLEINQILFEATLSGVGGGWWGLVGGSWVSEGSRGFSFPTLFTLVLKLLGRLNGIHHLSDGRPEDEAFHSDFVITAQNETDDLAAAIFTPSPPKGSVWDIRADEVVFSAETCWCCSGR